MLSLFALCCLCYVCTPQLILHHLQDNSISCLNVTYLFPLFAHSDSDIWHQQKLWPWPFRPICWFGIFMLWGWHWRPSSHESQLDGSHQLPHPNPTSTQVGIDKVIGWPTNTTPHHKTRSRQFLGGQHFPGVNNFRGSKKCWGQKNLGTKIFGGNNIFWVNIFRGCQNFGGQKSFRGKNLWVKNLVPVHLQFELWMWHLHQPTT